MLTKNSETSIKKLSIKGKYSGFTDFYDINKVKIYKNIINLFGNLKNKDGKAFFQQQLTNFTNE